jgi:shikimate kinase
VTNAGGPAPGRDNIVLIGSRGCGKSVVGRALAARLNRAFIDTDERIAEEAQCSLRELFLQHGEADFRDREHRAIREAVSRDQQVISVGGGAVLRRDNRDLLAAAGRCVWLVADDETLATRLRNDPRTASTRPPLSTDDLDAEVRTLAAQRLPYYQAIADQQIDTSRLAVDQVVEVIVANVKAGPRTTGA